MSMLVDWPFVSGYWNILGGSGSFAGLQLLPPKSSDDLTESIEYSICHAISALDCSNEFRRLYLSNGPCELFRIAGGEWTFEQCSMRMLGGRELVPMHRIRKFDHTQHCFYFYASMGAPLPALTSAAANTPLPPPFRHLFETSDAVSLQNFQ
jgi:hypothetical protein